MRYLCKSHGPVAFPRRMVATVAAAAAAVAVVSPSPAVATTGERIDVVPEWFDISVTTLSSPEAPPGLENARAWAIAWLASGRAVNTRPSAGALRDYQEAAVAAGVHESLATLAPGRRAQLDQALATTLARIPDGPAETQGVAAGRSAARGVLAERVGDRMDNASVSEPFPTPAPGPGVWQPTPPAFRPGVLFGMTKAKPFVMSGPSQFRPGPPPALGSTRYRADWAEVRDFGAIDSTVRTQEQTNVATFFLDDDSIYFPAVRAALRELSGSVERQAEFMAVYRVGAIDTALAIFDAKYAYAWWRPITAIRNADIDGDPTTAPDPDWAPLHTTPPHPDYVSGHATFAGAMEGALAAFTGSGPGVRFTLTSRTLPGVSRTYTRWSEITADMVNARVWSGIHTRTADTVGARTGKLVSLYVFSQADRLFG